MLQIVADVLSAVFVGFVGLKRWLGESLRMCKNLPGSLEYYKRGKKVSQKEK